MALFSLADIVAALFLLVAIVGAIRRKDERKSSKALIATMIVSVVMVLLDSCSGYIYPATTPDTVLYVTVVFSALASKGILMAFYCYCYQYFREKTDISKWLFIVPMILLALTMIAHTYMIFTLDDVTLNNGAIVVTGSMQPIIKLASVVLPLYLPALAIIKRKDVGARTVFLAGAPSVIGILISFIGLHDYGTFAAALVVFITYVLLQSGIFNQREQEQLTLQENKKELESLNAELEERQAQLEESTAEQEAQLEEISALNGQLQDNQAKLEEAAAEQEAQLEETQMLNAQLQETKDKISEAYGMIEGLSSEYHTIWVVNKETSRMRLVRSNGKSTIKNAVQMGIDMPEFDTGFKKYIETYVEPQDRERMHREIAFTEVLRHLSKYPDQLYAVNYLRRDDSGHVGYHQIAFANADTEDGIKQFVYGFRDIDRIVKAEIHQKQELEKAREAADAANKAKTTFLFNMSHDIRTPMNAVIGFTELLKKHKDDPEKLDDYIGKIESSSQFLLSLINSVLEIARIESGKSELDEAPVNVGDITAEMKSMFETQMQKKGITFTTNVDAHTGCVLCDSEKYREIYLNVLSNAYKYTPAGGKVSVQVKELPSDSSDCVPIRLTVSDTGIGMSKEFLPQIFEEFSRERTSTESRQEGTGLGMPIVKKLVDLMNGTIEVESEIGKGSTFIITIPFKAALSCPVEAVNASEDQNFDFSGRRLLLAEDNDLNAEIAMEILGEVGLKIERAEDGVVCVNMLQKAEDDYYDAILMDIQMPNLDGYEATKHIRAFADPKKANIPIIAMTANAFEEDKRNALAAGMNGHLAKPINVNELMRTLASILQ